MPWEIDWLKLLGQLKKAMKDLLGFGKNELKKPS
jgi:hypothetical protein